MKYSIICALAAAGLSCASARAMQATKMTLTMHHDSYSLSDGQRAPSLVLYMNEAVLDYVDGLRHPSEQGVILYECEVKMRDSILPIVHPQGSISDHKLIRQVFEIRNCVES